MPSKNSKLKEGFVKPEIFVDVFVQWFRTATPYIHKFRGKTFVIAFGGEVVSEGQFVALAHDLNLLNSLGVRLVLVHGARPQIEEELTERGAEIRYVNGLRVTDEAALKCVKEAAGTVRVDIEALLSMGLANSPMAGADIRVGSGNFVTAKPMGVRNGIDLMHTGEVRKIDAIGIRRRLDQNDMVLLSPLGYSPTGEVFNLSLEDVATATAIALDADKLIFLMNTSGLVDDSGDLLRSLTTQEAETALARPKALMEDADFYLPCAIRACRHGVARVHLISRHVDGALLQELFTHEGIGTMVAEDMLETLRPATIDDVGGLLALIEPLETEGTLVRRSRERLEMEIDRFTVLEYDGLIIGCAALYPFPEEQAAELACMAVNKDYRGAGRGEALLEYMQIEALRKGFGKLFVLTTRTAHWFVERGFTEAGVETLPKAKQGLYNYQRRSKVFVKTL
ncbi:MAG: amino-acid N-acetyltransferase [Sulfurimicrobium sp.]|jgi:amino-acid N-acetyltransferase|nr:amino-acid N-acetyltransferase [Sulfurimicrobium sp.]MDO9190767.1 amino-acid N-acetyltransferase [Sulfurimicrobium sp.]MDP2197642.1 amino-acid N-acetyltransferase [Sulfurimicrobium sp.]MDP2962569.1 amino-acid N-acetyltransferase [Sulfurimicrobium sp.]MDP3687103.1 amino-acid N-acetyltransferase [Sulfurimicrobium sp.]